MADRITSASRQKVRAASAQFVSPFQMQSRGKEKITAFPPRAVEELEGGDE